MGSGQIALIQGVSRRRLGKAQEGLHILKRPQEKAKAPMEMELVK
jgi:hypothetical protein